jgi:hypothetical protein
MSTINYTYNVIVDRFRQFAAGHFQLRRFTHGEISQADLEKEAEWPWLHVKPRAINYSPGTRSFQFEIFISDLPRDKEDKTGYQAESITDCSLIFQDLINEIYLGNMFGSDVVLSRPVNSEPFVEQYTHTLTGVTGTIELQLDYDWSACSIPASWNYNTPTDSGSDGWGALQFIESLDQNGVYVSLLNDEEAPGNSYYYGTNSSGVKGWYAIVDNVGLTCETLPECATIISIVDDIAALQTDKVDKVAGKGLSTEDYTTAEKSKLAGIEAGAEVNVNADWNAVSGDAQILNKPTIPSIAGLVPDTRTITINGTTQDLSANRTFTIATGLTVGTTPITSGTIGRVLFEGTGNVLQQSANLFWDATNNRLGIGTASPASTLDVTGTARVSSSLTALSSATIGGTTLLGTAIFQVNGTNKLVNYNSSYLSGSFYTYQAFGGWDAYGADSAAGTILAIGGYRASQWVGITFHSNGSERMRVATGGNVLINTTTDAGFKLDVNGNTRITGSGATSATNGLTVLNSALEEFLVVRNDGLIYSRGYNFWFSRQTATSAVANGSFLTGYRSSATGSYSFAANGGMEGIGGSSSATGNMSAVFGRNTSAYLTGQFAHSSYGVTQGGSQHSFVQLFRDIVGVSISELFINGSTLRATLPVANSIWVAKIYVNAVCNTAGGTTVLGAVFSGEYFVTLKRIGSTTTIVGTVSANEKADASMTTAIVLIDADDTNDSLRVQFTPPITAGATTAIRVMANLHLTELRY